MIIERKAVQSAGNARTDSPATAHNPEVVGSSPSPATRKTKRSSQDGLFVFLIVEDGFGSAFFCDEPDEGGRITRGERAERVLWTMKRRRVSEQTQSTATRSKRAGRQCLRGARRQRRRDMKSPSPATKQIPKNGLTPPFLGISFYLRTVPKSLLTHV